MHTLKALYFLTKCFGYIAYRIIKGKEWNKMTVTLENPDDTRTNLSYSKKLGSYNLFTHTYKVGEFLK